MVVIEHRSWGKPIGEHEDASGEGAEGVAEEEAPNHEQNSSVKKDENDIGLKTVNEKRVRKKIKRRDAVYYPSGYR